jgi:hypothetical protein
MPLVLNGPKCGIWYNRSYHFAGQTTRGRWIELYSILLGTVLP